MMHSSRTSAFALIIALLPLVHGVAAAQTNPDVTFELRPHCEQTIEDPLNPCPEFEVRDPLSRQTDPLSVGDTIDMDLILHNPSAFPVRRFRAWIGYDSTILEGTSLELSSTFPVPTPGEDAFSVADNYIKVSGSSETGITGTTIVLARMRMTVVAASTLGTVLSFYDATGTSTSHTGAFTGEDETEVNVASVVQGSLAVRLAESASASSALSSVTTTGSTASSSQASRSPESSSASSSLPVLPSIFTQLQVQGLRVTTEGSSVFLAWNPLPSAEIVGYNLYYGTISGRYLQRRSVHQEAQTLTIRALPVGQTYYFAVRAVSASAQESDFSQEVAVTVGNPATSTSPLSGSLIAEGPQGQSPSTDGSISGESGPGTWVALLVLTSAVAGTVLAARRQWTASVPPQ